MTTENENTGDDNKTGAGDDQNQGQKQGTQTPDVAALVKAAVADAIADIKGKLDKAYAARDEALRKVAELEEAERERERERLKAEGKHKEAYESEVAELKARLEAANGKNTELTRDLELRNALAGYQFRNDNARAMAHRDIVGQLVRDENGLWKHKNGTSIEDSVKAYLDSEDNAFLLKQKQNSGSGSGSPKTSTSTPKTLAGLSTSELLKMAKEGKLPKR